MQFSPQPLEVIPAEAGIHWEYCAYPVDSGFPGCLETTALGAKTRKIGVYS